MGSVNFLAELFLRTTYPPEGAIAADDIDRQYNVYVFDTAKPTTTTYWDDWGGNYDDVIDTNQVQVIMGQFLQRVETQSLMEQTESSFWINGSLIYMNIPKKPWQFNTAETEVLTLSGVSSSAKNPKNPSDTKYGEVNYPVRLSIPSVNSKLSDSVSGVNLFQEWSLSINNQDGKYDDTTIYNFFNTPVRLLKAYKEDTDPLTLSDFKVVRYGIVNNQKGTFTSFSVTASDVWRTLEEDVLDVFNDTDYPSAPDATLGKSIPKVWGSVDGVTLFETDTNEYYPGDYITAVSDVYDSDGNSLAFTYSGGIITEATGEAKTADVTGSTDNMIGQIIIDEIAGRSNIPYNTAAWDTTEADIYRTNSPEVNYYFTSGTVKTLVGDLLSNDDSFLIQKNTGLLTLRKWGVTYDSHTIPSWTMTSEPTRNYTDAKTNFLSAVQISYNKNEASGDYANTYEDFTQQETIFETWRAKATEVLEVSLANLTDVEALGDSRLARFGRYSETINVYLGYDTSEINLLDTVSLDVTVNGRQFSTVTNWIVKAVDTAQDTLTLEELVT